MIMAMEEILAALPPLCTPQALADATGIPVGTWAAWRSTGTGPSFTHAGRRVLYPRTAVVDWLRRGMVETV